MSEFTALSGINQPVIDAWIRQRSLTQPSITESAGGFPATLLDSLRKVDETFETDRALQFIRSGADMFAKLPGIELSTFDTDRDHIEVSRLTNTNMFTSLLFRPKVDNRTRLRPHYPKKLGTIPTAGLLSVFDDTGHAVVTDREVNVLEYATVAKFDQRQFDQIIGMLDKESPQVKEGLSRALGALVSGIGVDKPVPTGGQVLFAARTVMSLLDAGADPFRLQGGGDGDQERQPQLRMVRLLVGTLRSAKLNPGSGINPGATETNRIESAIERLLTPSPDTGTLPFDIEYREPTTGRTLLHYAVEFAGPTTVQALLHAGADIDAELDDKLLQSRIGGPVTTLSIAELGGNDQVVAVLHAWKAKQAIAKAIGNVMAHAGHQAS